MKPGKMINLVESIKSSQDDGDSESNHKGSGLWTQTVNNQMKRGYGMDDHQVSESSDSEVNDVNDDCKCNVGGKILHKYSLKKIIHNKVVFLNDDLTTLSPSIYQYIIILKFKGLMTLHLQM